MTENGVIEPNNSAMPMRTRIMLTYIGFRLNRNGPPVTKEVEIWNGLMVVWTFAKKTFAIPAIMIPAASGASPTRFQGLGMMWAKGKRKCNMAMATSVAKK